MILLYSFQQMLLPCEDNVLRGITQGRKAAYVGRYDALAYDIESGLTRVFEQEVQLQRRLDSLIRDCELRYDYTVTAAFDAIDRPRMGRLDTVSIGSFLRACGHHATEMELLAIVRRMDADGDSRVSPSEFSSFMRSSYPVSKPVVVESPTRVLRCSSPVRASPVVVESPVRVSPVRLASPVRYSPYREPYYWRYWDRDYYYWRYYDSAYYYYPYWDRYYYRYYDRCTWDPVLRRYWDPVISRYYDPVTDTYIIA